jgi:hypothetical protein
MTRLAIWMVGYFVAAAVALPLIFPAAPITA